MAKQKDPELAKLEAEQRAKETASLLKVCEEKTKRVPKSVITGSIQSAIAWKTCAAKAVRLLAMQRPPLEDAARSVF